LTVAIDRVLAGGPRSGLVEVTVAGWRQVDGEPETRWGLEDDIALEPGDHGVFFLYAFEGDERLSLINGQGVILLEPGRVRPTRRDDPLVRRLEATPIPLLRRQIKQAAVLTKAGRIRPMSPLGVR
jgi:hypothetical protein